ncbi:hypothetical protein GCM10027277_05240 [Pseudoduganella ginsengisoli]|uniref:hypothetical protein n=1 Tax=Pseudoduganella ginsengisoli TaxID=1462440 RepID=UPI001BAD7DC3|nr:hypothetical protein [Pseudoduganella ginsengisoli]
MELFNKSGVLVAAVLVTVGVLIGAQAKDDMMPPDSVIEATALKMNDEGNFVAERRMREWAEQGSAVAQRELALHYQADTSRRAEVLHLLEDAARSGDTQAATHLSQLRDIHRNPNIDALNETAASRTAAHTWTRY